MIEVASHQNTDIGSRVVQIMWDRHTTLWDYDGQVYDRMNYFDTSAWPVRIAAFHDCCPPKFMLRIIKPLMFALKDKESRSRTLFHDVPENDITQVLSSYGIQKDMLPTDMGGSLVLDQSDWIASRRAAELEEI